MIYLSRTETRGDGRDRGTEPSVNSAKLLCARATGHEDVYRFTMLERARLNPARDCVPRLARIINARYLRTSWY